jgi:adenylate kinase family enzyme
VRKVAVFGNAGGGKSALARKLAEVTRIPLYVVDMMQFRAGGVAVPHDEYLKAHAELLQTDAWIIDGFGGAKCAWERFAAADHAHLHRPAVVDALPVGDEAFDEGPLCQPARVARG